MSRSNPTTGSSHPAKRWFEWDGQNGSIRYYDKEKKDNVDLGDDFTFLFLDELYAIKGWHDSSDSGITSNEVRDTRQEVFVVKAFKGGILAEGHYRDIRDRVGNVGGYFVTNVYMAFKHDGGLAIGSVIFKGAALNAWVDFMKENRKAIHEKAVRINGSKEGKKGKVVFKTPKFSVIELSEESNQQANVLDKQLQDYLKTYLSRPKAEAVSAPRESEPEPDRGNHDTEEDSEIPF